jgi:hypothetical protein
MSPESKNNVIRLAQWTEKVNCTTSRDPLGLANRVSQRLVHQLLFGITAIGNRARYYSYSLWAIHDVMKREKPLSHKDLVDGIYWRDSAFVAACLIHHKNEDYDVDGAVGKDKCSAYLKEAGNSVDLASIQHIASNSEGGFGLNYKGSLINLGFFQPIHVDESQQDTVYEVSKQPAVMEMLNRFEASIQSTVFYQKYACQRRPVPRNVLEEFGNKVCLCLLNKGSSPERNTLRDILFERTEGFVIHRSYRPNSLRFILYCAKRCSEIRIPFTESQFRTIAYFSQYFSQCDESKSKAEPIQLNPGLYDIRNRWRIFFMHHYFSNAIEGLLVIVLNILSEAPETGLTIDGVVSALESDGIAEHLRNLIGFDSLDVRQTTVADVLSRILQMHSVTTDSAWTFLSADSVVSEERLIEELSSQIRQSHAKGAARCFAIILILLERCRRLENDRYWGWAIKVSADDPQRNISAPILYLHLRSVNKDWLGMTFVDFMRIVVRRFVVEQHELMASEKKAGTSWLTFDEGQLFYENSFDGPSPGSSRFNSAAQIMCDLGLMQMKDDYIQAIGPFSERILSEMLE